MTNNLPGVVIKKSDLAKFNESVYGGKGNAKREQIVEFAAKAVKDAFSAHGIEIDLHYYRKKDDETPS